MLERDRVGHALRDVEVLDFFAFGWKELVERGSSFAEADREAVIRAVRRIGIDEAIVPGDFPLALGDRLRESRGVLTIDDAAVELRRRAKTLVERDGIRAAQRAAEAGMAAARALLSDAQPADDGQLLLDDEQLLAEDVRAALRIACAEQGAACPPEVVVASAFNGSGRGPGQRPAAHWTSDRCRHLAAPRGEHVLGRHDTHIRGWEARRGASRPDQRARTTRTDRARAGTGSYPSGHQRTRTVRPNMRPVRVGGLSHAANGAGPRRGRGSRTHESAKSVSKTSSS